MGKNISALYEQLFSKRGFQSPTGRIFDQKCQFLKHIVIGKLECKDRELS